MPQNHTSYSAIDCPAGLMFHHFHDDAGHHPSQGSLNADELRRLLKFWATNRTILPPDEWLARLGDERLQPSDTCLTFDDGLKCQLEVALPVLEDMNLRAFWFVHSSPLCGGFDRLEIHRCFRTLYFDDMDSFYAEFFEEVSRNADRLRFSVEVEMEKCRQIGYLANFSFYTEGDRHFRYFRDIVLGEDDYSQIMDALQVKFRFDPEKFRGTLWLGEDDLRILAENGHAIGLHTHTHPTFISSLGADQQHGEYCKNQETLENIIGKACVCAAYPCGRYNEDTDPILRSLGVVAAFDSQPHSWKGAMHLPRFDHALVWKEVSVQYSFSAMHCIFR